MANTACQYKKQPIQPYIRYQLPPSPWYLLHYQATNAQASLGKFTEPGQIHRLARASTTRTDSIWMWMKTQTKMFTSSPARYASMVV